MCAAGNSGSTEVSQPAFSAADTEKGSTHCACHADGKTVRVGELSRPAVGCRPSRSASRLRAWSPCPTAGLGARARSPPEPRCSPGVAAVFHARSAAACFASAPRHTGPGARRAGSRPPEARKGRSRCPSRSSHGHRVQNSTGDANMPPVKRHRVGTKTSRKIELAGRASLQRARNRFIPKNPRATVPSRP
jgi:hypothetical protein